MSAGAGGGGGRLSGKGREQAGSRKRRPVRGIFGLFFCVASLVFPLLSAPQDDRREDLPPGFAPAGLSGKQFILEEIDSSGIREEVTLIFREGDVFDAARSAAKGAAGEDTGSYTYHRDGPLYGDLDDSLLRSGPSGLHRPPRLHLAGLGRLHRQLRRRVEAHGELSGGA